MHPVRNDAKNIKINEILEIYLQLYSDALLNQKVESYTHYIIIELSHNRAISPKHDMYLIIIRE